MKTAYVGTRSRKKDGLASTANLSAIISQKNENMEIEEHVDLTTTNTEANETAQDHTGKEAPAQEFKPRTPKRKHETSFSSSESSRASDNSQGTSRKPGNQQKNIKIPKIASEKVKLERSDKANLKKSLFPNTVPMPNKLYK